jgi:hypothetical protein
MRKAVFSIVVAMWSVQANAVEVKTVIDGQLLGGQNYYNGADSSFGGVGALTLSPYLKFSDQWSLVPLYAGNYRGTKQVTDLVGGGTLFQDSQDHTFSSKLIRSFDNGLKVKAVGGYGFELLRETKDEDWGKGLFDNRRAFGGTEAEWSWAKDRSVRLAYDYYRITFPNYQALDTNQVAISTGLGRELSAPNVLDNNNHAFTLSSRLGLPLEGYADLSAGYTLRSYPDQHLVVVSGSLIPETRRDSLQTLSAQGTWPISIRGTQRLFTTLGYSWNHLYSNQNHSDAAPPTVFSPNYYAYITHTLSNSWTLLLGDNQNPWTLSMNGSLSRQNYTDRPVQDAGGIYGTEATRVDSAYIGAGFSYPIAEGFRLAANAYFGWNNSNNQDNRVYKYHYNTQTYLMGFSYAY